MEVVVVVDEEGVEEERARLIQAAAEVQERQLWSRYQVNALITSMCRW